MNNENYEKEILVYDLGDHNEKRNFEKIASISLNYFF